MGRPNYQRILNAHGVLPAGLMEDFGIKIVESEAEQKQEVILPENLKISAPEATFHDLVDKVTGKKLVDMTWVEIRDKAQKDSIYKKGMKKQDILKAYLALPVTETGTAITGDETGIKTTEPTINV